MPPTTEALLIALLAVVPGFLASTTWARAKTWKGPSNDFRTLLQSLAASALVQLILLPYTLAVLYPVRSDLAGHPRRLAAYFVLAVLLVPIAAGRAASWLSDRILDPSLLRDPTGIRSRVSAVWKPTPAPSIWDWLFTADPPNETFLVIEFRDGRRLAGVFAQGSIALTSPEPHGLFLIQEWALDGDGNLAGPIPGSKGLMINSADDIRSIRILGEGEDVSAGTEPEQ